MPVCKNCGNEFSGKRSDAVFCSEKCQKQEASKRRRIVRAIKRQEFLKPRPCKECGKEFVPALRSLKTQVFCSEECRMIDYYRKRQERGRAEERRKYYSNNKEKLIEYNRIYRRKTAYDGNGIKAMERDGFKCRSCGSTEDLHIHHIDGSGQSDNPNNVLDNLITLCSSCHARAHAAELSQKAIQARWSRVQSITKEQIEEALSSCRTIEEAAKKLGITRRTLLLKRKQFGLPMRR